MKRFTRRLVVPDLVTYGASSRRNCIASFYCMLLSQVPIIKLGRTFTYIFYTFIGNECECGRYCSFQ